MNKVYVLDESGQPLKPTGRNAKVRLLLKEKKAIIVKYKPFTIRLVKGGIKREDIEKFRQAWC